MKLADFDRLNDDERAAIWASLQASKDCHADAEHPPCGECVACLGCLLDERTRALEDLDERRAEYPPCGECVPQMRIDPVHEVLEVRCDDGGLALRKRDIGDAPVANRMPYTCEVVVPDFGMRVRFIEPLRVPPLFGPRGVL